MALNVMFVCIARVRTQERGLMTHTQTERGRNQIRVATFTIELLLFNEDRRRRVIYGINAISLRDSKESKLSICINFSIGNMNTHLSLTNRGSGIGSKSRFAFLYAAEIVLCLMDFEVIEF